MGYPRFQLARAHKFLRRTSGNLTINSASWASVDTGLDITLEAQVGDVIEYSINGYWGSEAVVGLLDVVTVVSAAPVNAFGQGGAESNTNDGAVGWVGVSGVNSPVTGPVFYTVQAADVSGGTVTLRLRGRTVSGGTKLLQATAGDPLMVAAKNLGPMDPN